MIEKITLNLKNKIGANLKNSKYIEISTQNGESLDYNITNGYYIIWDNEKIKRAFNFGKGKEKDFLSYAYENKHLAKFYRL